MMTRSRMFQMVQMHQAAGAYSAPACAAAPMTMPASSTRGLILDTALLAVSFLFALLALLVRIIIIPTWANP